MKAAGVELSRKVQFWYSYYFGICSVPAGGSFLDLCRGIFDALAIRAAVFLHDCHHFLVMFLARPIALEFEQHLQSGKGHGSGLINAANRRIVGDLARAARSVLDGIDAI